MARPLRSRPAPPPTSAVLRVLPRHRHGAWRRRNDAAETMVGYGFRVLDARASGAPGRAGAPGARRGDDPAAAAHGRDPARAARVGRRSAYRLTRLETPAYLENTAPCGAALPENPWGQVAPVKLIPGLPSAGSRNRSSSDNWPVVGSKSSRNSRLPCA